MRGPRVTDKDILRFTCGDCHVFAMALHRLTGWMIWIGEDHAYCVEEYADLPVDIEGVHTWGEFQERWGDHEHSEGPFTPEEVKVDWAYDLGGSYTKRRARLLAEVVAQQVQDGIGCFA